VTRARKREGIGRLLLEEAWRRSGAGFVDLFAGEAFYESFRHERLPGYRLSR